MHVETMHLELSPEEVALVGRILADHLSDLRMEIGNTEDYDLRQSLKQEEAMIKSMLARLGHGFPGAL